MGTTDQAKAIARKIVSERFPIAEIAFCAGSIMRGEGTPYSDIDLVLVFPSLQAAWRESFMYGNWPVEAFLHDGETLRYFFEEVDAKSGVPSLPQMVSEGFVVWGEESAAQKYIHLAKKIIDKGPSPLTSEDIRNAIYGINDLVDDLREPRSKSELVGTGTRLYEQLADFALRSNGQWSGSGKHIPRALNKYDSILCKNFVSAFEELFKSGDTSKVIALAENITDPFGGLIFDGYKREAPSEWRKR